MITDCILSSYLTHNVHNQKMLECHIKMEEVALSKAGNGVKLKEERHCDDSDKGIGQHDAKIKAFKKSAHIWTSPYHNVSSFCRNRYRRIEARFLLPSIRLLYSRSIFANTSFCPSAMLPFHALIVSF